MNEAISGETQTAQTQPGGHDAFERFLLAEYDHIAQAHFTTVQSISHFFQYYVLIASLPVSGAVAFGKLDIMYTLIVAYPVAALLGLSAISLIGISVMGYAANLRFDAVLYARTINGLRQHFFSNSGLALVEELRFRVLPRSVYFPRYLEMRYFGFVILTFTIVDLLYAMVGWWIYLHASHFPDSWTPAYLSIIAVIVLCLHALIYLSVAAHREHGYLKGHIIGVDIDGVLGRHRKRFCEIFQQQTGREISQDLITKIPVNECQSLNVTEDEERAVFHEPAYWKDMPFYDSADYVLKRLRDMLCYQVWVFSWREWPNWGRVPQQAVTRLKKQWTQAARASTWGDESTLARKVRWRRQFKRMFWWRWRRPISRITRDWLWRNGVEFDRLLIEQGNVDSPDRVGKVRNRFIVSQDMKIRLFVEDDLNKARRLAGICEVVFLIRHPYNQNRAPDDGLPNNIIEVDGWMEIYDYVRHNL